MAILEVIIALGSNLGKREALLAHAMEEISLRIGLIVRKSSWHETDPVNHPENADLIQPKFLNGVAVVQTLLKPQEVLDALLAIEKTLGRSRKDSLPWGPREIDLDLIAYADLVFSDSQLTIPHPEMHKREFVLAPLCEIYPEWKHPVLHHSASEMLKTCQNASTL